MSRFGWAGLLPFLAGCLLQSPFDGTWLFHVEYQPSKVSGTCEATWDSTVTWAGTDDMFVDIYTTTDDEVVVFFEQALKGEVDGREFEAKAETVKVTGDRQYGERLEMRAEVDDDDELAGKVTWTEIVRVATSTESCEMVHAFRAERTDSDPDRYVRE